MFVKKEKEIPKHQRGKPIFKIRKRKRIEKS